MGSFHAVWRATLIQPLKEHFQCFCANCVLSKLPGPQSWLGRQGASQARPRGSRSSSWSADRQKEGNRPIFCGGMY